MDTRAYRINWEPKTHIYEIDQTNVLHYKESALKEINPNCTQHLICADLKESLWSQLLLEQGYKALKPSIWLLEGFLYYLNPAEVHNLSITIKKYLADVVGLELM